MFCALSGEPVVEPVVSKNNGVVYEKRLIKKYLEEHSNDPIDGTKLTDEDLIPLKIFSEMATKPRLPTLSSVPSLLSTLQSEWDSAMLEMYQLNKMYDGIRKELSNALYELDAAKRVISRLMAEKEEAVLTLAKFKNENVNTENN